MIDFSIPAQLPSNIEELLETVFLLLLLIISIVFTFTRNVISSIALLIFFSVCLSVMYLLMNSPDVSMTEASVGAAITTIIPLSAFLVTGSTNQISEIKFSPVSFLLVIILGIALSYGAGFMPLYGDFSSPIHNHIAPYYLAHTSHDIGINSTVTAILASYRGFDTLGETLVILTAGLSVFVLLYPKPFKVISNPKDILIEAMAKIICPIILIFAFYIQIHGELSPGGGFQAGAIMASSFILCSLATSSNNILSKFSFVGLKNMSIFGFLIYASTGAIALYSGENFLNYYVLATPSISGQELGIFLVELGVGITVFSVLTYIFLLFSWKEVKLA